MAHRRNFYKHGSRAGQVRPGYEIAARGGWHRRRLSYKAALGRIRMEGHCKKLKAIRKCQIYPKHKFTRTLLSKGHVYVRTLKNGRTYTSTRLDGKPYKKMPSNRK